MDFSFLNSGSQLPQRKETRPAVDDRNTVPSRAPGEQRAVSAQAQGQAGSAGFGVASEANGSGRAEGRDARVPSAAPPATFAQTFAAVRESEFYTSATAGTAPGTRALVDYTPPRPYDVGPSPASHTSSSSNPAPLNSILVSRRQEGNPILKLIRNVRWQYSDIVADYQVGADACALYLSLRYHLLHSDYLHFRIRELQRSFTLRVVLCYIDVEEVVAPLAVVTKLCVLNECTLLCCWSHEEAARYLETLKSYESKPADAIQARVEHDYLSRLAAALTSVRGVNRSDVHTLSANFGSLADLMAASQDQLALCPGIGPKKVKRISNVFHAPFKAEAVPEQLEGAPRLGTAVAESEPLAIVPAGGLPADATSPNTPNAE